MEQQTEKAEQQPTLEDRVAALETQIRSLIVGLGVRMVLCPDGVQIQVPPKSDNMGLLAKLCHSVQDLQAKVNGGPLIISPN